jgi:serine/threonine-protein kinase
LAPVGQVSPDGKWFWDGKQWSNAVSSDGAWRWNGTAWVATAGAGPGTVVARGFLRRIPGFRSQVPWKMGVAAVTYLGIAAIIIGSLGSAAAQPPSVNTGQQVALHASPSATAAPQSSPTSAVPPAQPKQSPSPSPRAQITPSPKPKPVVAPTPKPVPGPYAAAKAAGATAVCADGTWSYSQHRSGTCSHHGGVHWWTGNLGAPGPGGH